MPNYLKALFVILVLATIVFAFTKRPANNIIGAADFTRRRNLWFALTIAAFLSPNFWVLVLITVILLSYAKRHENNPLALFFFILFVLPMASVQIPGMGLVNFIFDLTYIRLLTLLILVPAFLSLRRQSDHLAFGRTGPDKALFAYLLLSTVLYLRDDTHTLTSYLRQSFYAGVDVVLPYIVVSRSLKSMQAFREVLLSLVIPIMVLALIACAEFYKQWLLYEPVTGALQMEEAISTYLIRDGMLRVVASAGQPIVLGYLMAVGIGLYLFLQHSIPQKFHRRLGMALLVVGLLVPVSRGPWIGSIVLLVVFVAAGRFASRRLMSLALVAMLVLPLLSVLPGGERVINLLPFVGSTEKENVDYRSDLLTNATIVIMRNPWFGSTDYLETPEMEAMRQGQGIIDIVNSYLSVTLISGFVGLGLFLAFFAATLWGILRAMRSIPDKGSEEHLLGRALLSSLMAILVIIFTVSSISFIPIVYWSVAGMGVAYIQMVRKSANGSRVNSY